MESDTFTLSENGHRSARSSTLKRINMRRFLDELRKRGPSTRAELTRATGVAPPTSSTIIADLLKTGLLEEAQDRFTGKGRPGKLFRLASESAYLIGLKLSPDECMIAPAGLDGRIRQSELKRFKTPDAYDPLLSEMVRNVRSLQAECTGRCLGLGISVPGLVDEKSGRVAFSPNIHFTDGKELGRDLSDRLRMEVHCIQEEHAFCLAEQSLGPASAFKNFACVDITFGMGMGVVSDGRYVSGRDGFAGEIGHITVDPNGALCGCGNRGCLETVATDTSFLHAVRMRLGEGIGFEELLQRVRHGELDVSADLESTVSYLAIGIAAIINVFNPDAVLVSGRLFELGDNVLPTLIEKTRKRTLAPSKDAHILQVKGDKLAGVLAGMLDHVFAAVGPVLQ